jgi:hypothetical protein
MTLPRRLHLASSPATGVVRALRKFKPVFGELEPRWKMISIPRPRRIEGYAIVSEDGMLANAAGVIPDSLKFEADRHFFERGLDGVDVVVHGRHSHERQPRSYLRRRLILTGKFRPSRPTRRMKRRCCGTRPVLRSSKPWLRWGRQTAALASLVATEVFGMFLDTVMMFSTCRRRPMCGCPAGDRSFPRYPRGLRRTCLQAMASAAASGRCVIRQKGWRLLAGDVRQSRLI